MDIARQLLPGRRQPPTRRARRAARAHASRATRPTGTGGPSRGSSRPCSRPGRSPATAARRALRTTPPQRWLWSHPFSADDLRSLRAMKQRAEQEVARQGLGRSRAQARAGRHPRHRVHRAAPAARARPRRRRPALADHPRGARRDGRRRLHRPRGRRPAGRRLPVVAHRRAPAAARRRAAGPHPADRRRRRSTSWPGCSATATPPDGHRRRAARQRPAPPAARRARPSTSGSTSGRCSRRSPTRRGGAEPRGGRRRASQAFGFTDAKRTQAAVRELTRGLNRSSRLMQQMLPLLLDWLSTAPDPDLGLLQLRNLLTGPPAPAARWSRRSASRPRPPGGCASCSGTSRLLGRHRCARNPDLVVRLPVRRPAGDPAARRAGRRAPSRPSRGAPTDAEQQEALRRWNDRHLLGIAARDVLGVGRRATSSDATSPRWPRPRSRPRSITLDPQVPFAVIAMGRFGGGELSYASDLDVIFVYDGTGPTAFEEADRVATGLQALPRRGHAGRAHLRDRRRPAPRGQAGSAGAQPRRVPLATGSTTPLVWERQAMIRARAVAGDLDLGERLLERARRRTSGTTG